MRLQLGRPCTFAPMVRHGARLEDEPMQPQRTSRESPSPRDRRQPSRIGRYSNGIERLDDTPDKLRRGRFSSGIERLPDTPAKLRRGRFSTGNEHLPTTREQRRRGSYATGARQT
jgi:hypothetical protein